MSVHAQEHSPLSLTLAHVFPSLLCFLLRHTNTPTQEQTHKIHEKNPQYLSLFLSHRTRHRNTKTLQQRNAVTHSCMNTQSLHSPQGCHQKQPLCPTLCKRSSFYSLWSQPSLWLPLTPPFLRGAFQSFHVTPPL